MTRSRFKTPSPLGGEASSGANRLADESLPSPDPSLRGSRSRFETAFHPSYRWPWFTLVMVLLCSASCREPEPPLTRDRYYDERMAVDTLYITEDGHEVIAPGNRHYVVAHPETGQLAWAAVQCHNPDCPGQGKQGRPYLFVWPNPFAYLADDGTVAFRQPQTEADSALREVYGEKVCPECVKRRDREAETAEQRTQYQQWCQFYVLPKSAKKLAELDERFKRRVEQLERRRAGQD